jgi:isoleucyl-tRNA synthetase
VFLEGIDETTRTTLLTFWNTYSFFVTYANLDGWAPLGPDQPAAPAVPSTNVLDRWLRSRLHSTVAAVTERLDDFDALGAAQAVASLVDDTSNWWVRRSRDRFWKGAGDGRGDRAGGGAGDAAHRTLYEVLRTTAQLLAPFTPFLADEVWRNLVGADGPDASVHLSDWPAVDAAAVDPELEVAMAVARRFVVLGRAARADDKIRTRQPLPKAFLFASTGERVDKALRAVIADELNVRTIEELVSFDGLLDWTVVPNFRALGPKLGKRMPRVKELLATVDGADVQRALTEHGAYVLDVDGDPVELTAGELEIRAEAHAELALAQDGPYHVALDLALDDDLRGEGFARELVRALNDLRKATGREIADRITVGLFLDGEPAVWATRHQATVAAETLATSLSVAALADAPADAHRLTIDGVDLAMAMAQA